jgi:hypothetical protein
VSARSCKPSVSALPIASVGEPGATRRSRAGRALLAIEILAAYVQARHSMRRSPIESVIAGLRSRSPAPGDAGASSLEEARRLGWAVTRLLVHVPGDTRCLVRSLVLTRLLARRGIEARLVMGARAIPEFLAHAWVEHAGRAVLDPGDDSFGRLVEL